MQTLKCSRRAAGIAGQLPILVVCQTQWPNPKPEPILTIAAIWR